MAFPTTSILDDFNRGSLGAGWTVEGGSLSLVSNQLRGNGYGYLNGASYGPDCEAYATIVVLPASEEMNVVVRYDPANQTGYGIRKVGGANQWRLFRYDAGYTSVSLALGSATFAAGDKLGVRAVGSTISAWLYSGGAWSKLAEVTDTTYTAAGRIWVYIPGTTGRFDDLGGGAVVNAPTNTAAPTIAGATSVGSTLTSSDGTWTNAPTSYTRTWYRDGVAIATGSTYVVAGADQGHSLTFGVVATNAGGSSSEATSAPLAIPVPPPPPSDQAEEFVSLRVEVAWGSRPGDESYAWQAIHDDDDPALRTVERVAWSRGLPNEYGRAETGTGELVVAAADGRFDADNPGGSYYPNVKRMRPVRATLTIDTEDGPQAFPLFQHFVDRFPRGRRVRQAWAERTIQTVDGFAWFALASIAGRSYAQQTTGARWNAVLSDIGWPASRRAIDSGASTIVAAAFDAAGTTKALEHLLAIVDNEDSLGFMNAQGYARLISRHALPVQFNVPKATFADGPSLAGGDFPGALGFVSLADDETDIVNQWTGEREGGPAPLVVSDAASIADYGPRSDSLSSLLTDDNQLQAQLEWRLARTKESDERIDAIVVKPGNDRQAWLTVAGLEVGDAVIVVEQLPGHATPSQRPYVIRHLAVDLPAAKGEATFTYQLLPTDPFAVWVLGTSELGVNTRLGY